MSLLWMYSFGLSDDVRAAAEGQDAHDLGLLTAHHLEAGEVAVGRAGGAEHVDGVLRSV